MCQPVVMRNSASNLIIISSSSPILFHPTFQLGLRSHFETYGRILSWTPLAHLSRIQVHYSAAKSALMAQKEMDRFVFEDFEVRELFLSSSSSSQTQEPFASALNNLSRTVIRVFFGSETATASSNPVRNPVDGAEKGRTTDSMECQPQLIDLLKPPSVDKNFLISPPGSPPVGWEQIVEDAPNQRTLADDLCQRLRFLSVGNEDEEEEEEKHKNEQQAQEAPSEESCPDSPSHQQEIVVLPARPELQLPALKVHQVVSHSPSPGMDIHLVKATIESMMSYSNNHSASPGLEVS